MEEYRRAQNDTDARWHERWLINPSGLTLVLAVIAACLVLAHIAVVIMRVFFDHDYLMGLAPMFDLWQERNIPTYFSAGMLLLAAGLLATITAGVQRDRLYWMGMALVFAFLSVDEAISIHELLILPVRTALNTSGALYLAWVIPYGVAVFVLGIIYWTFLLRLPSRTRLFFFVAAGLYLSGALGFEMIGAIEYERTGRERTILMDVFNACEESLEMSGVVVFIYALAGHLVIMRQNTLSVD